MKYLLSLVIFASSFVTGQAASSDWQDLGGGQARMLAVLHPETGIVTGGVEIKLQKGWKTYWRSPGDSGIPPQFDFSNSIGFTPSDPLLPAPTHIVGKDASYVGYKQDVTFVFKGRSKGSDGKIDLNLFLGVCEEICIPAQAHFEIPLSALFQSDPQTFVAIEIAQEKIPTPPSAEFKINAIELNNSEFLDIAVKIPSGETTPQLFVEGPSDWYLEPAKLVHIEDQKAKFRLDLSNVPINADRKATQLRYTIVSGAKSIEEWRTVE